MVTIGNVILILAASAVLFGCDQQPKGPGGEIWKEEVRLMNGDLIVVDRRNVWGESGDLSQGHGPLTEAELRFTYKGKYYEWSHRGLGPAALQEDSQGRMYTVSLIHYCWAWREWGRPDSYYVMHRFEDGKWKRVDISKVDPSTIFNLAGKSSEPGSYQPRDYVLEAATKYATNSGISEHSRRIVPSAGASCQ